MRNEQWAIRRVADQIRQQISLLYADLSDDIAATAEPLAALEAIHNHPVETIADFEKLQQHLCKMQRIWIVNQANQFATEEDLGQWPWLRQDRPMPADWSSWKQEAERLPG